MTACPSCGSSRLHERWCPVLNAEAILETAAYPTGQPYRVDDQDRTPWDPTRYGPNRHLSRHAADLWATPLRDLREALTDLARATIHVLYDATLGRRHHP